MLRVYDDERLLGVYRFFATFIYTYLTNNQCIIRLADIPTYTDSF